MSMENEYSISFIVENPKPLLSNVTQISMNLRKTPSEKAENPFGKTGKYL
jgi:hypothetical protein